MSTPPGPLPRRRLGSTSNRGMMASGCSWSSGWWSLWPSSCGAPGWSGGILRHLSTPAPPGCPCSDRRSTGHGRLRGRSPRVRYLRSAPSSPRGMAGAAVGVRVDASRVARDDLGGRPRRSDLRDRGSGRGADVQRQALRRYRPGCEFAAAASRAVWHENNALDRGPHLKGWLRRTPRSVRWEAALMHLIRPPTLTP